MNKKLLSVFLNLLLVFQPLAMSNAFAEGTPQTPPINFSEGQEKPLPLWAKCTILAGEVALPLLGLGLYCKHIAGSSAAEARQISTEAPVAPGTVQRCRDLLRDYSDPNHSLTGFDIYCICNQTISVLQRENTLLEINPNGGEVIIVGDVHGNLGSVLYSLNRFLDKYEQNPNTSILFLGDYVDRGDLAPEGPKSVEIVTLLFQLKQLMPNNVFLLRGNHEDTNVNRVGARNAEGKGRNPCLKDECDQATFKHINEVFEYLSLAAVINGHVFCVHGGISQNLTLERIRSMQKPIRIQQEDRSRMDPNAICIIDMLWSDPDRNNTAAGITYLRSRRGAGLIYTQSAVTDFYRDNPGLNCIVRGHQEASAGHIVQLGSVHTVFSAFNYRNDGDIAKILIYSGSTRTFAVEVIPMHRALAEYVHFPHAPADEGVDKAS